MIHEQSSERVMPLSIGNVFRYRSHGVCYEGRRAEKMNGPQYSVISLQRSSRP